MRSSVCMMVLRLEQSHMPVSRSDSDRIGIASDVVKVQGEDPATPRLGSEVC